MMLRLSLIALLATGALGTAAQAQCVQTGLSVTCTGTETDGFRSGDDDLTLEVVDGATVSNDNDALRFDGDDITVTLGAGAQVISAEQEGIQGEDDLNVTIAAGALVDAGDEGVTSDDDLVLVNNGTIRAVDDAVQIDERAMITNNGVIESLSLASDPQDAIDLDSGTVINNGTIRANLDAAIDFDNDEQGDGLVRQQAGIITGTIGVETDPGNLSTQVVEVLGGTIEGTSGLAINLGAGADSVTLAGAGTILGAVDLGSGQDSLSFLDDEYEGVSFSDMFDGGADQDTVAFEAFALNNIFDIFVDESAVALAFGDTGGALQVRVDNFELFAFGAGEDRLVLTREELSAVPLPAAAWMLLAGLGGLAAAGRRRP